ncbi:MAG: hypothetical protein ACREJV_00365 [Candidatus Rokuibacteriota bacterium]
MAEINLVAAFSTVPGGEADAISLANLRSRVSGLPADQELIFYCA